MIKICLKCKKELPLTEFHKNKSKKDRLYCYCKICERERKAKRYADPNNHDRILEASKKSQAKRRQDPIKRQKINEMSKKLCAKAYQDPIKRQKHNEACKKYCAKRYTTDPEFREYRKRNSDKRHRDYDGIRLAENIIDEPVIRHHINDNEVIDVPRDIHTMYPTYPKEVHRFMVNQVVEQLYNIKLKKVK